MTRNPSREAACPVCGLGFAEDAALERHAEAAHDVLSEFLDS